MFKFFFLAACVATCAAAPKPKADVAIALPVATYPSYPAIPAYPAYPAIPLYEGAAPAIPVVPSISSHHSAVVHSALPTAYSALSGLPSTYSAYPAVSTYSAFPATYPAVKTYSTGFTHF